VDNLNVSVVLKRHTPSVRDAALSGRNAKRLSDSLYPWRWQYHRVRFREDMVNWLCHTRFLQLNGNNVGNLLSPKSLQGWRPTRSITFLAKSLNVGNPDSWATDMRYKPTWYCMTAGSICIQSFISEALLIGHKAEQTVFAIVNLLRPQVHDAVRVSFLLSIQLCYALYITLPDKILYFSDFARDTRNSPATTNSQHGSSTCNLPYH